MRGDYDSPTATEMRLYHAVQQLPAGLVEIGLRLVEQPQPGARQENPGKGGPPVSALLMTAAGLREELAGLRFERCEEVDRDVAEGSYHQGPSTTVQVLAFKP